MPGVRRSTVGADGCRVSRRGFGLRPSAPFGVVAWTDTNLARRPARCQVVPRPGMRMPPAIAGGMRDAGRAATAWAVPAAPVARPCAPRPRPREPVPQCAPHRCETLLPPLAVAVPTGRGTSLRPWPCDRVRMRSTRRRAPCPGAGPARDVPTSRAVRPRCRPALPLAVSRGRRSVDRMRPPARRHRTGGPGRRTVRPARCRSVPGCADRDA